MVIQVSTFWEGFTPLEIESEIIEEQEARLGQIPGLVSMTSTAGNGSAEIRLEFENGTDIDDKMAEVDQKLAQVPFYPANVARPTVSDVDPESVDYISWMGLASTDPSFDPSVLFDFMERTLKPRFERLTGVSEVGIVGTREPELRIVVDPVAMAQRGVGYDQLLNLLSVSSDNYAGGAITDGKQDVRIRAVGRFSSPMQVEDLVLQQTAAGPVYVRDIAEVTLGYKEPTQWVRARGLAMPFFNFQLAQGANLLGTMEAIKAETAALNEPGGVLAQEAARLGLDGTLELVITYDSSTYLVDAIDLVQSNILFGGSLAILVLLLFLRSPASVAIVSLAIPVSVLASMVVLVSLGRTINIISLAGIAFATGMVVDNAIVVLEKYISSPRDGQNIHPSSH